MTAEEKASILFTLMWGVIDNGMPREEAKRCALIAVDEILEAFPKEWNGFEYESCDEYWKQVKQEILKL